MKKALIILLTCLVASAFTKLVPAALEKAAAGDTTKARIPLYTDGTYKVSAEAFDDKGWKPFAEVTIANDQITAVTFDYTDQNGGLKTADADLVKGL